MSKPGRVFWAGVAGGVFACLFGVATFMLLGIKGTEKGFTDELKRYALIAGPIYMILFLPVFGMRFFWRPAALQWIAIPVSVAVLAALAIFDGQVSRIIILVGAFLFCLIVLARLFIPLRLPIKPAA